MRTLNRICAATLLLSSMAVCAAADVDKEARQIAELMKVGAGSKVADLGAGDGEWSVALAAIVGERGKVFATEVDQAKIDKIDRLLRNKKLDNVETVLGNQDSTGLQPGSVDGVLIRLVYHHFANPEKMHSDLKQALRPADRVAIVDFGPENNYPHSSVPKFRKGHGVGAESVIAEMTATGFQLVERRDIAGRTRRPATF